MIVKGAQMVGILMLVVAVPGVPLDKNLTFKHNTVGNIGAPPAEPAFLLSQPKELTRAVREETPANCCGTQPTPPPPAVAKRQVQECCGRCCATPPEKATLKVQREAPILEGKNETVKQVREDKEETKNMTERVQRDLDFLESAVIRLRRSSPPEKACCGADPALRHALEKRQAPLEMTKEAACCGKAFEQQPADTHTNIVRPVRQAACCGLESTKSPDSKSKREAYCCGS